MARNNTATTVTELIHELEAVNDIINYTEIAEEDARKLFKDYMARWEETGEDYWRKEASRQFTKAEAFEKYRQLLTIDAIQ